MTTDQNPDRLADLRTEYANTGMVKYEGAVWLISQVVVLREQVQQLAAAVPVPPPADQTALRDRLADALYALMLRNGWDGERTEPVVREMDLVLDAVLAVLPEPTDRGAVLREAADAIDRKDAEQGYPEDGVGWATAELRRMAAEEQTAETQEPETEEQRVRAHVLALHQIGEQLAGIESWMWEHLANVRATERPVERPRCPHCQLPHDLTPGSLPAAVCASTRQRIADAAQAHTLGDHSGCCRADCDVLRAADDRQFGSPDCTCIPFTRQGGKPRYCGPTDTVDMISGWEIGRDCPHHKPAVGEQPETQEAQHLGGRANAEDCPACTGTNPPYPFLCPGPDAGAAQPGKQTAPCDAVSFRVRHDPHSWEPEPDADLVRCPGYSSTAE